VGIVICIGFSEGAVTVMLRTRKHASEEDMGMLQLASPQLIWLMSYLMWESSARAQHAEDRKFEEHVDLGGEGG